MRSEGGREYRRLSVMDEDGKEERLWVCQDCGSVVGTGSYKDVHDRWHDRLVR